MSRRSTRAARLIAPFVLGLAAVAAGSAAADATPPAVDAGAHSAYDLGVRTLRLGSLGPSVAHLQTALNDTMHAGLKADGRFGPSTQAAVIAFQRSHGLEANGVVGPDTRAALNSAPKAPSEGSCKLNADQASAPKVIVVDSTGGSNAITYLCDKRADGTYDVTSVYTDGHVGKNGIAAPGAKREGDGKTPSGTFALKDGFGVGAAPAEWHNGKYTDLNSGQCHINNSTGNQLRCSKGRGGMSTYPAAYKYGQVIGYNQDPFVVGKGSGILLHRNTGSGHTLGCVSESEQHLHDIFAWEGGQPTQIQIRQ